MRTEALMTGTMADMTGPMIAAAAARGAGVLLPIGVMEHHGPHLAIGTDAYLAGTLCRLTREHAAQAGVELLIAPPFYWGINQVLSTFPGTFRVRPEIAAGLLADIIETLVDNGFEEVLLVSHHGDLAHNRMILDVVNAQHGCGRAGVRWLYAPALERLFGRLGLTGEETIWLRWEEPAELDRLRTSGILGVHAEEYETAGMARYHPDCVAFDVLLDLEPTRLGMQELERWRKGGSDAQAVTPDGYFGAPNPVDPDLWRSYDWTARAMAAAIASKRQGLPPRK